MSFTAKQIMFQAAGSSSDLSALTQHGTKPATKATHITTKPTKQGPPHLVVKPSKPPLKPRSEGTTKPSYFLDGTDPNASTGISPAPQPAMVTQAPPTPIWTTLHPVSMPVPNMTNDIPPSPQPVNSTEDRPKSNLLHDTELVLQIMWCVVLGGVTMASLVCRCCWKTHYESESRAVVEVRP